MKKILSTLILLVTAISFSQKNKSSKIGNISLDELKMTRYSKDTTANAVVLNEHANYYLDEDKDYKKTTDYYFKIKIINKDGANKATIKIPFYGKESVSKVKGITYNLSEQGSIIKNHLTKPEVFTKDINDKWKEISFTLPNIKAGSVIEYVYSITSPYSNIDDWYFQSDIPKVKSDFTASILGNWKYSTRLVGFLKLDRDNPSVKRGCVYMPGTGEGNCLILEYGMDDIPAFKEENYMLSKENFISKLSFELKSFIHPRLGITKYTKTWKDADRSLKYSFLDNQSSKKKYFKKHLDPKILTIQDNIEKATKIFQFIQNHYTWNDKYWPSKKVNIKKAFESKIGNVFDINLSLYNSLQAVDIESYLVLSSTRNKAVPTKLHPVINDFNYLIVKTIINGTTYFLDATSKQLPFGLVQYQSLNGDGRVMDFKNGSYWEAIKLNKKTYRITKAKLTLSNDGELTGDLSISSSGYFAVNDRKKISNSSTDSFIEYFESNHSNIEVDDFNHVNLDNINKPLNQIFKITFDQLDSDHILRINPFLISQYKKNPFKLDKREYPINYGYARNNSYLLSLKIPENFTVKKLPQNKAISIPNKGGRFIINFKQQKNIINVYSKVIISKKNYNNKEYYYLKEFYNQIIKSQDVFIEIEKASN